MSIQGHISIVRDDGEWSTFKNKIVSDHIPAMPHALAGRDEGVFNVMGIGNSADSEDEIYLNKMTSEDDNNKSSAYTNVQTHGPVLNLKEANIEVNETSDKFFDYSGAVFVSGTFGEGVHRSMDGKEISEIALFTGDRDYMFARTVIPESERLVKLRNQSIKISWMIVYGVGSASFTRRDWAGDGYGFMYGQNYGQ